MPNGQVRGLRVDDVDLRVLGDKVQDDLLGRVWPGAGILNAKVDGIGVNGENALSKWRATPGDYFGVVRPTDLHKRDRRIGMWLPSTA